MWPKSILEAREWINHIEAERDWVDCQIDYLNRRQDGWEKIENRLCRDYDLLNQRINLLEDWIIQTYHSI